MLRLVKSRRGSSLIDIMITIALLSVAGIIFSTAFPTAIRCSRQATGYKLATAIAQKKMEQLRTMNYESLSYVHLQSKQIIDSNSTSTPYSFTSIDNLSNQLTNAAGSIQITDDSTAVKEVTVTITWSDQPANVTRTVTLTTLFSDKRTRKVT